MADAYDLAMATGMTDPRPLPDPAVDRDTIVFRAGVLAPGRRIVAAEAAVAMTFNRLTHAVMMATPADLDDFALGFALAERIVDAPEQVEECLIVHGPNGGLECRMWIAPERIALLERRRRRLAGVTGCGMCGLESLDEALRPPPVVPKGAPVPAADVARAVASLRPAQALNRDTRAVHGAGFWSAGDGLLAIREDVGRHNALDKLRGALARAGRDPAGGIVVLTSRLSVELVGKAALMGATIVAGVSAPTGLALEAADVAGITLVGVAREDGFEIFTRPDRITG